MDVEMISLAGRFKALGDPTRLHIMQVLGCCPERLDEAENAPSAGEVCCQVTGADGINSTISHHLKELREAGLILMEKDGKKRTVTLRRDALKALAADLIALSEGARHECC